MAKITGQNAWSLVRQSVQAGERLNTWSLPKGNLRSSFVIEEIGDDVLKISLDSTGKIRTLSSGIFHRLGDVWSDYVAGRIPRHRLRDLSQNTSYELALLKRVSDL